jgi:CDGSH-type Zn-finger protein
MIVEGGLPLVRLVKDEVGLWTTAAPLGDAGQAYAVCRCGRSSALPLCDAAPPYRCFDEAEPSGIPVKPVRWDVPDPARPAIGLKPNGPARVAGDVPVETEEGALPPTDRISLCRCGASRAQPRCDGSHKVVGFTEP